MTKHDKPIRRGGVTLLEMLVVIGIILILAAVAVPLLKFSLEDRKTREASRVLNAYLVATQSMAAERQRPVGIWIERMTTEKRAATQLFVAEAPPPYSGDLLNARASISNISWPQRGADGVWGTAYGGSNGDGDDDNDGVPNNISERGWPGSDDGGVVATATFDFASQSLPLLVQVGDSIRFDNVGADYQITNIDTSAGIVITFKHDSAPPPGTAGGGGSLTYQISRRPMKSSAGSIELPKSSVIDLTWSGGGISGTEFIPASPTDDTPVVIMFGPNGNIDRVYHHFKAERPLGPVHLLIGRSDQLVGDAARDNLHDATSLWVSIGHRTGSVTTSENTIPDTGASQTIAEARELARRAHVMGGR